jgi:hypothetical protein
MTRLQKDVTEVQIFLGLLFIILPVLFMHPSGINCIGEEWVHWGFWQRLQSPEAIRLLTGFTFGFHCINALFAMLAASLTLINRIPFWIKTLLRLIVSIQLVLFPFWASLLFDGWQDACIMQINNGVAFILYMIIACMHFYLLVASFITKEGHK